ncbi:MAG: pilus assembly protein TadG-related protein [Candidatus Binatus sp.]
MKKKFGRSRGQIMVLYAGILAALLGAVALGTDVAVMYTNWQQTQKTADAAALAGANFLSGITYTGTVAAGCSGDAAKEAACTYAVNNGLTSSQVNITEPTTTTIKVVATQTGLPYFFARAVGMKTYDVSATAVANSPGPVGTVNQGLFPVGLQCNSPCSSINLNPGQGATFGQKFDGGLLPGNWGWLAPDGPGVPNLAEDITNGASTSYSVGDPIGTKQGNVGNAGPVKSAFAARIKSCPTVSPDPCADGGNPTNIPAGDPCLIVVPAVDFGANPLVVEGFAEIYLEGDTTSKNIDGCFISSIAGDTITSSTAPGLGTNAAPVLIQ